MAMHVIEMGNNGFEPAHIDVQRGDTVWWVNKEKKPHSARSDDGRTFNTGELNWRQSNYVVFDHAPGPIPYHDKFGPHKGTVFVK